jgi:hypothetical protein
MKWKKPFQCQVDGIKCIIGKEDNPIMQMKPVMVKELSARDSGVSQVSARK